MTHKKIFQIVLVIVIVLASVSIGMAASYEIFSGGFSSCKNLTWSCNSSATSEATTAVAQWNNVSSKVSLRKAASGTLPNINISAGVLSPPNDSDLGMTTMYKAGKAVAVISTWDSATCIRYDNPKKFSNVIFAPTQKIATTTHEIGHALSMAHCADQDACIDRGAKHIMHRGVKSSYALTSYDESKLKYKWGN